MSKFDGVWNLVTKTPMGPQPSVLTLAVKDGVLTGSDVGKQGNFVLENGKVEGDEATWSFDIKKPFPMRLSFKATVEGDALSGSVKAGTMGNAQISGKRQS